MLRKILSGDSKKIAIIAATILLAIIAWSAFIFFTGNGNISAGQSFAIKFEKLEDQIFAGYPFTVSISFANESNKDLEDVVLSIALPEDVTLLEGKENHRNIEDDIGNITQGSENTRNLSLIATGGGKRIASLTAKLTYGISGSKARFEQEASIDLAIGLPAAELSFDVPENVFNGEDFSLIVRYRNNTPQTLENLTIQVKPPSAFRLKKSEPEPKSGSDRWEVKKLAPREESAITLTGNLVGPEESFFGFQAKLSAEFDEKIHTIYEQSANLAIASSPLSISITPNDDEAFIAEVGRGVNYAIRYKNNSNISFQNLTVRATLEGELFDFVTARSNGAFNSLTNTFTWITANSPELARLDPGEEGTVSFGIELLKEFPIKRISDKNFLLKVKAQIESPTVPEHATAEKTTSVVSLENKVRGRITIDAQAYFRDALSGILNSGSFPPQVNQPTEYTIHWVIRNFGTDMTNVRVSAFLQSGSEWTGKVKTNAGNTPRYEPTTGEVTWEIPIVPATKGVIHLSTPLETIFQIRHTPAVNQAGNEVTFMGDTTLRALDAFTGVTVETSDTFLSTSLPDDPTVEGTEKSVHP